MDWKNPDITALITAALEEDLGGKRDASGDITAVATVAADSQARASIFAKQPAVVAGLPLIARVFTTLDSRLACEALAVEGEEVKPGRAVFRVAGATRSILAAERTALNFLAHLSGVATTTRQFVGAIAGTRARIRDTRKTTPLHRALEKYAVTAGGGANHRFGLYDAMLIKENHIAAAGGVGEAIRRAQAVAAANETAIREMTAYESFQPPASAPMVVQVEVRNEAELREALAAGAQSVLLDNQTPDMAAKLVSIARSISRACIVEVSGGVTLSNVRAYAESGADYIAIGAITHSAPAADFSLLIEP